jgi:hypothetical protein
LDKKGPKVGQIGPNRAKLGNLTAVFRVKVPKIGQKQRFWDFFEYFALKSRKNHISFKGRLTAEEDIYG